MKKLNIISSCIVYIWSFIYAGFEIKRSAPKFSGRNFGGLTHSYRYWMGEKRHGL